MSTTRGTRLRRLVRRLSSGIRDTSYQRHKPEARQFILRLLLEYSTCYGFTTGRVAVRDTRRRWGSCSAKGHLNFSYKLVLLPECMARYIVVHELCHLRQLNHSKHFWQEVATIMPDYEERVGALRRHERTVGTSIVALQRWKKHHDASDCLWCRVDSTRTDL